MKIRTSGPVAAAIALAMGIGSHAHAANPITGAIGETKPIFDFRVRQESVEQEPIGREASAVTARLRLGFETGKAWNTSLLAEGEFINPLQEEYNSTLNGKTMFPVVADPESYELNRLQLVNTSIPGTTLTIGRQRINLDDQRFVGAVGWRQNEQTFDAVRIQNRTVTNLVFDATFFNQVQRVFGEESLQGRYEGDSFLGNVSYQTKIGKITAFGYLLDLEAKSAAATQAIRLAALRDSTSTYGLRFAGEAPVGKVKLGYIASYATQTDYADNPWNFDLDYINAEVSMTWKQFSFGVGEEILEGNGQKGFTTPLATLHKFNGWADKFLATPANGLEDLYVNAGVTKKGVGPLDTLGLTLSYHEYQAEFVDLDYGNEINAQLAAKWKRVNLALKYADYSQGIPAAGRDTEKWWAQLEFVW